MVDFESHPVKIPLDITYNILLKYVCDNCGKVTYKKPIIEQVPEQPNLGCATTRELLDEIRDRIEIDGNLDYRTVGIKI